MAHEPVQTEGGLFAVDWDVVEKMIESNVRAYLIDASAYTRDDRKYMREWTDVFNWAKWKDAIEKDWLEVIPVTYSVEVDWKWVREHTEKYAQQRLCKLVDVVYQDPYEAKWQLRKMQGETRMLQKKFRQKISEAQWRTQMNIETAVNWNQAFIDTFRSTRDVSGDALMIGATFLTGGAALAVIGAGATVKASAKVENPAKWDEGNAWAAAGMTFSGEVIFGLIPYDEFGRVGKTVVVTLHSAWDGTVAWVEGKAWYECLLASGSQAVGYGVQESAGKVIQSKGVKRMLENKVVPVAVKFSARNSPDVVKQNVSKAAKHSLVYPGKKLVGGGAKTAAESVQQYYNKKKSNKASPQGRAMQDSVVVDEWFLDWAIIDCQTGI